jgi:hypothetical protein
MLNAFNNIIRVMARRAAMTRHEKILSDRSSEELCLDLARTHAGCLKWTECDTCKRLTRELRSEWVASGLRPFVPWLMLFDHASLAAAFLRSLAAASVIARSEEIKTAEKKAHAQKREVFLRRCTRCERTFATRFHFERIAVLLRARRSKPLSKAEEKAHAPKRDAFLNCCMTAAERQACKDLSAVLGDPNLEPTHRRYAARRLEELREHIQKRDAFLNYMTAAERQACKDSGAVLGDPNSEPAQRQYAAQRLKELRDEIDRRSECLDHELLRAVQSSERFKSRADRMFNKIREFESINSKKFFEKPIRRYLTARLRNATWAASLPLLKYLAVEYVRDPRALWRFLDAAFARWKDFKNPKSVRHRSIIIHQLFCSQFSLDECKERGSNPMGEVAAVVIGQGAVKAEEIARLNGALRTQKSRELRKCDPRRKRAIVVTLA